MPREPLPPVCLACLAARLAIVDLDMDTRVRILMSFRFVRRTEICQ
jgi:hypothetical protein